MRIRGGLLTGLLWGNMPCTWFFHLICKYSFGFARLIMGHPAILFSHTWFVWVDRPHPSSRGHPTWSDICGSGMSRMQSLQVYHFDFEWGHQIDFLFFRLWHRCWLFLLVTYHRFDSCLEEIWRLGVLGLDPLGFPCLISCLYRSSWRGWGIVYFRYVARYSSLECLKLFFWFLVVVILFRLFYMLVHLDFDQVI